MDNDRYPLPDPLVTVSPQWLGGMPVFTGRRVTIQSLFDYLKSGETLEAWLGDFPDVSREHAEAVIEAARRAVSTGPSREAAE